MFTAMLAVVLLAAQVFAAAHETDLAAHTGDQVCHVCVSLGGLGAANVASETIVAVSAPSYDVPVYIVSSRSSRPLTYGFARGPPSAS
jgi:hypothetical protein